MRLLDKRDYYPNVPLNLLPYYEKFMTKGARFKWEGKVYTVKSMEPQCHWRRTCKSGYLCRLETDSGWFCLGDVSLKWLENITFI